MKQIARMNNFLRNTAVAEWLAHRFQDLVAHVRIPVVSLG